MYSCNVLDEQYAGAMAEHGFVPEPDNRRYGSMGLCWRQAGPGGSGYFWTYGQQDLYMLKIHDFYFHEDQLLEFCWPESLSVTWYESISGEEFSPCRRLVSGCVKSFIGGREPYRALIHRRVPIVSIGIEITPAYYQDYLRRQFSEELAIRIPAVSRSSSAAAPGRARQRSGRSPTHGKQSERTRRTEKARRQEERQPPALGLLLSLKEPVNDLQSHRARYLW